MTVDEMEHRLAVGAHDDEVGIQSPRGRSACGQRRDDEVVDGDGFALHLELDGALVFVGEAVREQGFDASPDNGFALRLKIRAASAFARAGGVAGERAFIPVEAEPAQAVEDDVHGFLGIARGVGVLDAQDKRAAGVAGRKAS